MEEKEIFNYFCKVNIEKIRECINERIKIPQTCLYVSFILNNIDFCDLCILGGCQIDDICVELACIMWRSGLIDFCSKHGFKFTKNHFDAIWTYKKNRNENPKYTIIPKNIVIYNVNGWEDTKNKLSHTPAMIIAKPLIDENGLHRQGYSKIQFYDKNDHIITKYINADSIIELFYTQYFETLHNKNSFDKVVMEWYRKNINYDDETLMDFNMLDNDQILFNWETRIDKNTYYKQSKWGVDSRLDSIEKKIISVITSLINGGYILTKQDIDHMISKTILITRLSILGLFKDYYFENICQYIYKSDKWKQYDYHNMRMANKIPKGEEYKKKIQMFIKNTLAINQNLKLTTNHFKYVLDNGDITSFKYLLDVVDLTDNTNQQLLDDIINLDKKRIAKLIVDYLKNKKKVKKSTKDIYNDIIKKCDDILK
jgi:hypothetical protein